MILINQYLTEKINSRFKPSTTPAEREKLKSGVLKESLHELMKLKLGFFLSKAKYLSISIFCK